MSDKTAYKLDKVYSTHKSVDWTGIDDLATDLENGYIVLWQYHGVFTGKVTERKITWHKEPEADDKHNERIRAFNESKEYHFWRSDSGLRGRLRTDGEKAKDGTLCVDTDMLVRGVIVHQMFKSKEEEKWYVTTRNYIAYNEIGQAGYVDSRLLKIDKK